MELGALKVSPKLCNSFVSFEYFELQIGVFFGEVGFGFSHNFIVVRESG